MLVELDVIAGSGARMDDHRVIGLILLPVENKLLAVSPLHFMHSVILTLRRSTQVKREVTPFGVEQKVIIIVRISRWDVESGKQLQNMFIAEQFARVMKPWNRWIPHSGSLSLVACVRWPLYFVYEEGDGYRYQLVDEIMQKWAYSILSNTARSILRYRIHSLPWPSSVGIGWHWATITVATLKRCVTKGITRLELIAFLALLAVSQNAEIGDVRTPWWRELRGGGGGGSGKNGGEGNGKERLHVVRSRVCIKSV